jgi:hypothetical protein
MRRLLKTILFTIILMTAQIAWAGTFGLVRELPKTNDINVGDEILISVRLNSEGTKYNALQGVFSVSDNLEITNAITGSSLISVWLENPSAFTPRSVSFSGIVPAGYNGQEGGVVSFVVTARAPGPGLVKLSQSSLFANDSHGTQTALSDKNFNLSVTSAPTSYAPYKIALADVTPPEAFTVELLRDSQLFGGKYGLVFGTQDKGSGVVSYDVTEGHHVFKHVESPYLLVDQSLHERIYVQATDGAGNTTVSEFVPPGTVCIGIECFKPLPFVILIVVILGAAYIVWRRNKQSSKN